MSDKDEALIKLPVIIVIKVAVLLGLNLRILNLALPILVPTKSPNVEISPPSKSKKIIKSQPDTKFFYLYYILINLIKMDQLNLFASAIGSKTVIFFLSIVSKPDSFKSPNNLVIVTLVEPIASAIA